MSENVSEMVAKETVAEIMESCGQIDLLITNNSSICPRSDVLSTSIDEDVHVMNVNYFSPIAFTKGRRKIYITLCYKTFFPSLYYYRLNGKL